ncbi:MAG: DNA double-strand break repair nuclease NurA [Tissierellia bacterium]|nr:DNA double-strand break repair nuclease NurA [Tissierellia bacterium]
MKETKTLRRMVEDLGQALRGKYSPVFDLEAAGLKERLEGELGKIYSLDPLSPKDLEDYRPLVGVDGSNQRRGGAYPHYIEIFQGLAKSTQGEAIFTHKIHTPLLSGLGAEEDRSLSGRYLAEVELEAALLAVKKIRPRVLMLDGGFIRFTISAKKAWQDLVEACEDRDILLIGAIKDTKTHMIADYWGYGDAFFDKDLLYGKLAPGDFFLVDDDKNSKGEEGFSSGFYRASRHPEVVGLDMLSSQKDGILDMARLLLTLTPRNSRGVNFWIDIVDKEVKLTDDYIQILLEESLDRDLYERFFISERDRRN